MNSKIRDFIRLEWLQLALIAVPCIAALAAMPFVTQPIPMQWNLRGEVNWYASGKWGLLVMPGSLIFTYVLIFWMESRDKNRRHEADGTLTAHGKATRMIRLVLALVLGAVTVVQISWALGHRPDVSRWVVTSVALLCAFIGNLFGKLKPNRYVGIRVPWTLNSERVWRRTHRASGWIWTLSSLVVAVCTWVLPASATLVSAISTGWLVLLIPVPLWIAWREAVAERREKAALR